MDSYYEAPDLPQPVPPPTSIQPLSKDPRLRNRNQTSASSVLETPPVHKFSPSLPPPSLGCYPSPSAKQAYGVSSPAVASTYSMPPPSPSTKSLPQGGVHASPISLSPSTTPTYGTPSPSVTSTYGMPSPSPSPKTMPLGRAIVPPVSPEAPTTPKLTHAKQTYGDFKRARAAQLNLLDLPPPPNSQQYQNSPTVNTPFPHTNGWIDVNVPLNQLVKFPPPSPSHPGQSAHSHHSSYDVTGSAQWNIRNSMTNMLDSSLSKNIPPLLDISKEYREYSSNDNNYLKKDWDRRDRNKDKKNSREGERDRTNKSQSQAESKHDQLGWRDRRTLEGSSENWKAYRHNENVPSEDTMGNNFRQNQDRNVPEKGNDCDNSSGYRDSRNRNGEFTAQSHNLGETKSIDAEMIKDNRARRSGYNDRQSERSHRERRGRKREPSHDRHESCRDRKRSPTVDQQSSEHLNKHSNTNDRVDVKSANETNCQPQAVPLPIPVRRDIGGFFVRDIPTTVTAETKELSLPKKRSRSRDRVSKDKYSRSRNRRRSRSKSSSRARKSRSRSRSRSRRKSRSRSKSRDRRSRSRSRPRKSRTRSKSRGRRSRSRSKSRSRRRGSSRSRSRSRGRRSRYSSRRDRYRSYRRSRSRNNSRRSRSRDRSRRTRRYRRSRSKSNASSIHRSESSTISAFRRELSLLPQPRNERRDELINKWRRLDCKTDEELEKKLDAMAKMNTDELLEEESKYWIRSAPATTYYERDASHVGLMRSTSKLLGLCQEFQRQLIEPASQLRAERADCMPQLKTRRYCPCTSQHNDANSSCSSASESEESYVMEELHRKIRHPYRLHKELWYNESGEMNDGPLCKCSMKAKRSGIRHGLYAGEVAGVGTTSSVVQTGPTLVVDELSKAGAVCNGIRLCPAETNPKPPLPTVEPPPIQQPPLCQLDTNNAGKLYHYRISISPPVNFLSKTPTIICHDGHEFLFTGFSLFSHYPLPKLPECRVIRFNIEYRIIYSEETYPENFTIRECNLFFDYLFREILELVDLDLFGTEDKCPVFHFMPRFVRDLQPEGHELLPMSVVMKFLLSSYKPLVPADMLPDIPLASQALWLTFAEEVKGMIVTKPGMKPSSIRVDQLDKDVLNESEKNKADCRPSKLTLDALNQCPKNESTALLSKDTANDESKEQNGSEPTEEGSQSKTENIKESTSESLMSNSHTEKEGNVTDFEYPIIVHFGIRPPQLSYAGNPEYQLAWREYVKRKHLIANRAKPTLEERVQLSNKEAELQRMRSKNNMKRDVTVTVSSDGFNRTGLMCDVVQHALLIPVLSTHLRFHRSLDILENRIGYTFKNRSLLQLALTHPSYRENFGTNPDHARNSLTNCGIRHPEYGDRRIHYMSTKKRGITTLMSIMSRFGSKAEKESSISHYERLEFLGDAVVEFVSTIHLFHIFRDLEEGGLATYRAALVQNQHLALLAKVLSLDAFLLYSHGSDLCHDIELNHALANCFESLMGALYLDGGIDVADRVFSNTVFGYNKDLLDVWVNYPPHILQEQEPDGDRQWIERIDFLQNLAKFEESMGIQFRHIRLLARAFTDRSVGYTNLTLGSNQRLEFLGDSVLQLTASNYLYKHFPEHHEGHLSLLRSSLVNNNTQSVVCDDLGMTAYARYASTKGDLKIKDRADLLEALLGALYIDTGTLDCVEQFCNVCFFPRLQLFIMNQEWNDPKSKLQQCCLTLRTMDGAEPDIPSYKVVESKGPTNTRQYSVAVYFRGTRLATATGHSIQQAEMHAAQVAMQNCQTLFPQLYYQNSIVAKQIQESNRSKNKKKSQNSKKTENKNIVVPTRTGTPERYKIHRSSSPPRRNVSSPKSRRSSRQNRSSSRESNRKAASERGSSHVPDNNKHRSKSSSPKSSASVSPSPTRTVGRRSLGSEEETDDENNRGLSPTLPSLCLFSKSVVMKKKLLEDHGARDENVDAIPEQEYSRELDVTEKVEVSGCEMRTNQPSQSNDGGLDIPPHYSQVENFVGALPTDVDLGNAQYHFISKDLKSSNSDIEPISNLEVISKTELLENENFEESASQYNALS